eukprot:gene14497-17111_t
MDQAAKSDLDIVVYLHNNRTEGCSSGAMNNAASKGRLDICQFLQTNRTEGCTMHALDRASCNGHLEVVEWLVANKKNCTGVAIDGAANRGIMEAVINNRIETLEYLMSGVLPNLQNPLYVPPWDLSSAILNHAYATITFIGSPK